MIHEIISNLQNIPDNQVINYIKGSRNEHTFLAKGIFSLNNENYQIEYKPMGFKDRIDLVIHRNDRIIFVLELKVILSHHLYANSKYMRITGDIAKLQKSGIDMLIDRNHEGEKDKYSLILIKHVQSNSKITKDWNEFNRYNKSGEYYPYKKSSNEIENDLREKLKTICQNYNESSSNGCFLKEVNFIKKDLNTSSDPQIKISLLYGLIKIA